MTYSELFQLTDHSCLQENNICDVTYSELFQLTDHWCLQNTNRCDVTYSKLFELTDHCCLFQQFFLPYTQRVKNFQV